MDVSEFVKKQLELITIEKDEEVEEQKKFLETLSLLTLQRKGLCISKIKVGSYKTGMYGRCIVKFEPQWTGKQFPSNSFSSGDIAGVWASSNDGQRQVLESGVVTSCSNFTIHVAFEKPFELLEFDEGSTYALVKLSNDVTYRRMKRALENLDKYERGPAHSMIQVLFGSAEPRKTLSSDGFNLTYKNPNLNEPQKEAIKLALSQREIAIIHGPPGTGKTTTVVELIQQVARKGLKILVCAPSNIAVDNLLERLATSKLKLIRLGHPARVLATTQKFSLDYILSHCDDSQVIMELRKEIDQLSSKDSKKKTEKSYRFKHKEERQRLTRELKDREKKVLTSVLKNADVILSTLVGASDESPLKHLPQVYFDIVVIDECSQALEAACWIPLLKAPKCLLAGDHLQLPPTIFSKKAAEEGLEMSLMERLVKSDSHRSCDNSIVKLLEIQYRMHQDIMKLSSSTLYDDKLIADASVASHLLKDLPGIEALEITSIPLFLIDTAGCNMFELEVDEEDSKGNEGEADLVTIHVENLIKSGVDPKDIAVIAPYNLQVELIRCRLAEKYPTLEIRSVDGFQGREKEVVVLTLVRSNERGEVGFLSEDRRINVAITRAKRHLAVICDSVTVSHHSFLKSLVTHLSSHGEVQSANQYSDQLDNVEVARPEHLKFKKQNQNKTVPRNKSTKEKTKLPPSTEKEGKKYPKKPPMTEEDKLEFDEKRRLEYEVTISTFVSDKKITKMEFPSSFTSFDRMLVHEIAENFGLIHISEGEGEKRHIVLYKKPVGKKAKKSVEEQTIEVKREITNKNDVAFKNDTRDTEKKPKKNVVKEVKPEEKQIQNGKFCSNCSKAVPETNYVLHVNHCQKVLKEQKVSKNKPNLGNLSDDGDEDLMLDNLVKSKNVCSFSKCKANVTLLGQICQFCKNQFCLSHHMAEIHGCGDDAKSYARSSIRKEVASCKKETTKKLDPVKRIHVQRKLDKKLDEMASQRKSKKK